MFILKSQQTIQKAIERARIVRPKVRVNLFGEYSVMGHSGNYYRVICERRDGQKIVDCTCPAGQHGTPCYHSAAAVGLHICLAEQTSH